MRTRVVISVSSRRDGFINGADVNELVHALQSSRLVTILLYSGVAQLCLLCRSWSPPKLPAIIRLELANAIENITVEPQRLSPSSIATPLTLP